jgi:glutamyl-tRNA reductase
MNLIVIGISHKTAPVALRERYAFPEADPEAALRSLSGQEDLLEAVVISTCNRVELIVAVADPSRALEAGRAWLAKAHGETPEAIAGHVYVHERAEAARHVFRVASSLDSLVVGEPQILGQVKDAYRAASQAGSVGPLLNRLLHRAFSVAKRVRSETGVAEAAVSVSAMAVQLAMRIFDTLDDKRILLLGAGEMVKTAARHLRAQGATRLTVLNRTLERAEALAREVGGEAAPLDALPLALPAADIVIASLADSPGVVSAAAVREALHKRDNRTMFFIDIAVPRNIDPAVNDLDNAYLYNLDDLGGLAEANARGRQAEATRAEAIVREEADAFMRWITSLEAVPTITNLTAWGDAVRRAELEKALASLGPVPEETRRVLEGLANAIVRKLLHRPIARIRSESEAGGGKQSVAAAKHLFDLDDDPPSREAGADKSIPDEET